MDGFTLPVLVIDARCLRDSACALTDGYNITLCMLREVAQNLVAGDCIHCSIYADASHGVGFGTRHDSLLALIRPNRKSSYSNASISRNAILVTSVMKLTKGGWEMKRN